ncbi:glycerophosphodiester phosphodiesterase family protein [Halobacteriales archaeon Cl-PHB]
MVAILYTFNRRFMRKTFEAIDDHVPVPSAYLPLRPAAEDASSVLEEVRPPAYDPEAVDRTVRNLDPTVVVQNHRFGPDRFAFLDEYPVVHVRHGASVGRGEVWNTTTDLADVVDEAHDRGLDVVAWKAARTPEEIAALRAAGVDGVTADRWDII